MVKASVKAPLEKGDVYPESFDSAYAAWQRENDNGGAFVCDSSVVECL